MTICMFAIVVIMTTDVINTIVALDERNVNKLGNSRLERTEIAPHRTTIARLFSPGLKGDKVPPSRIGRDPQDQIGLLWISRGTNHHIVGCILPRLLHITLLNSSIDLRTPTIGDML